ncbi:MAG: hypothetical protein RBS78_00735 [Coriobacteriia bacterium]|jgi:hypothetical protein|nr:hypothetical protein [Coriobacteriia bacterium]
MVVTVFSAIMLALGIGLLVSAVVYIIGFAVSAVVGAGVATVDSAIHHGHPHGAA